MFMFSLKQEIFSFLIEIGNPVILVKTGQFIPPENLLPHSSQFLVNCCVNKEKENCVSGGVRECSNNLGPFSLSGRGGLFGPDTDDNVSDDNV